MGLRDLALIVLFAAIIAALGWVPKVDLPFVAGVPITAQSMGVTLAGVMLGARRGAMAAALFVLLVLFGAPLLAGGRGGIEVLAGPTAGFILGFIPAAYASGYLFDRWSLRLGMFGAAFLASVAGGYVLLNLIGIPVLMAVNGTGLDEAAVTALSLLPGGLLKALATGVVSYVTRPDKVAGTEAGV